MARRIGDKAKKDKLADGSQERPFDAIDGTALSTVLGQLHISLRFNLRSMRVEFREPRPLEPDWDDDAWIIANKRWLANLFDRIARQYRVKTGDKTRPLYYGRERRENALDTLVFHDEVDPFEKWLDALPPWNGVERLSGLLHDLFGAEDHALTHWAGRYVCLGAVQRVYEPGCKLDEIPVLIGPQGIGKSTLLSSILPPEIQGLFSDSLRWDGRLKDQVDAVLGRVIVEVSEMAGRKRTDIETMKGFISRTDDGGVRLPWARTAEPLPRRFVMVATTNNENDLPNDPSGNRRFVPILLTKGANVESFMSANRRQLWAEGLYLYRNRTPANLPRVLHADAASRAEDQRDADDVIENAVESLPLANLAMTEIIKLVGDMMPEHYRAPAPQRIAKAMILNGWRKTRRLIQGKKQTLWLPPTSPDA